MAKVKRKQIEYEGTNKQVIKGNGELGDYDDKVIVELTTIESQIKNISNEELSCNKSSEELLTILTTGKLIDWRLKTTTTNVEYYTLLQAICVNSAPRHRYNFYKRIVLYLYDFNNNGHLYITVEIIKQRQNTDVVLTCTGNYINNITRTHNHETLYPVSAGDANLHDGFYFPNATQDADGNWYGAVVIGDQVWLGENLRTTKYADGTPIPQETEAVDAAAYFDKTTSTIPLKERGLLYNWYAVMNGEEETDEHPIVQGVAPTGWHIPSIKEYSQLRDYIANQERYNHFVDSYQKPNCNLKVISSIDHWTPRTYRPGDSHFGPGIDSNLNNAAGLNLKPINGNSEGTFVNLWTSTKSLEDNRAVYVWGEDRTNSFWTSLGYYTWYNTYFSVRCVSDLNPIQFRNWYIQQYGSLQHHLPEEVQAQSDWNQTDINAIDFIKNKPTIKDDRFVFEFTTTNDVTQINNEALHVNTDVDDLCEAILANKYIEWRISYGSPNPMVATLSSEYNEIRIVNNNRMITLDLYDRFYSKAGRLHISVIITIPETGLRNITALGNYESYPHYVDRVRIFYGYTNSVDSDSTKIVTLGEPTSGFENGSYITLYFAGGSVIAGNSNAISIDNNVYYLAYKAQGITQAGVINQGDKVLLWCHNGFAHVISNDRWSLPTITAADEGKILKVVNGTLALVNP